MVRAMKGIDIILHVKAQTGLDGLNNPIYSDDTVIVRDVLVGQPSTDDITSSISLYGKRVEFLLGIPKGDEHVWTDTEVEFFGRKFKTFGDVIEGIEANVPTRWHKKVRVERYG